MEGLRGQAHTRDSDAQQLEAQNAELQSRLLLWAQREEELEARWAGQGPCLPRASVFSPTKGPPSSAALSQGGGDRCSPGSPSG